MVWEAQMEAADTEGLQRVEALMIDVPGELVWDLPWPQHAIFLEGDVDVAPVPAG